MEQLSMKEKYEDDFTASHPDKTVQYSELKFLVIKDKVINFFPFIDTGGHGYLCIPKNERYKDFLPIAKRCTMDETELAYYLEEDCEKYEFLDCIEGATLR